MGVISKSRQIALKFRSLMRQYYHLADGFGPKAINDCRLPPEDIQYWVWGWV
jgi:hypothetical protein